MKVLKWSGNLRHNYRVTCPKCNSLLEYGKADIHPIKGTHVSTRHITCPKCRRKILHDEDHKLNRD